MPTLNELEGYVVIPREDYETMIAMMARMDSLMDLILSDNHASIPTICRVLGRHGVAQKVEERNEEERKQYDKWVQERGGAQSENPENNC